MPSSGLQYTRYIHFRGLLSLTEFCDVQNSLWVKSCVLLYWQGYCTALEHKRRQPNCGVQQRAPPIYGRAAIALGAGPHSSFYYNTFTANFQNGSYSASYCCESDTFWLQYADDLAVVMVTLCDYMTRKFQRHIRRKRHDVLHMSPQYGELRPTSG